MPIDEKLYHRKWSLIRRLILKRACNKCEHCGVGNGHLQMEILPYSVQINLFEQRVIILEPTVIKKVVLAVAHLDRNRNNNRFWNLKALCQKCHLKHDLLQRVYSFKYGKETQYKNFKLFTFERHKRPETA